MKKELIELKVNGRSHELAFEPSKLLLDVLRQDLDLTGSKRGCDDSSCGACTVLVDGIPMMSCTLLGASCEGQEITTVEGVSEHGSLAAIQKAYGDWGGAQCGYCTPGFIMTVKHLLAENPEPTEPEIRGALSGNLCRCTGYSQMYQAIKAAIDAEQKGMAARSEYQLGSCHSERSEESVVANDQRRTTNDFSIIGKPTAMVDAAGKTTGAGKYTDDLSLPGMLVGRILHSPYPHARIKRIDTSRAEKLEGVVAVVVGKDAPNPYGILPVGHDEYALALDKVRYVGDNVACVAAVDEATADQALELIDVDYELLPAYFDPEESMKAETDLIHDNKPHNLEKDYHHVFGDPEKGFAEADHIAEARFIANEVTHAAMEPHSTLAAFEIDSQTGNRGRLTVQSSTQVPYYLQHKLSLVLEMPMAQIRVIKPLVGGGFGGKSEVIPLEIIAAIAARKALAPVKITYTREEVFWAHRGRPRTIIDLKTGITSDGRITAVKARVIQDGGAYCSYGVVTILYSGALLGALYDIPNIQYDGYRVLTNKPVCGAMRGHGTVNVRFAFESQLDELAARIAMDPAEIRQRNLLQPPCITVNGLRVQSYGLPECIEKTVERSGWKQRRGKLPKGRGLGIACSHYVSGAANSIIRSDMPHSTVNIKIDRDGGVVVYTGASEIGQGSDTMTAQIAAETLGCSLGRIKIIAADTDLTPIDIGSYSSRVTFMAGNATLRAATEVKKQITLAAARKMNCAPEDLDFSRRRCLQAGKRSACRP